MRIYQFSKYLFVIMAAFFLASCEDDPVHPPINEINEDAVMTIAEIRDHYNGEAVEFTGDAMLFATVVMDEHTGNIYRSLIVQDETGGIDVRLATPSQFSIGDSLRISLDGAVLDAFEHMLQLDNIDPNEDIVRQATEKYMEPQTIEIEDIDSLMQAQLIKLEGVQFALQDAGETYAYPDEQRAASRTLLDQDGNSIVVRTSGYADFAGEPTPEGSGSLIAVVSQYQETMQLFIRSTDEVEFDNERFPPPGEDADLLTIAEIRQMLDGGETSLPDNSRLEGVIISNREYQNHPGQNAYIMDEHGDGIALRFDDWHSLNYGDEVRVIVSNMSIGLYNGLLQIEDIPTGNAHSLGEGEVPEPTLVTIGELNDNFDQYESTLIHIEDVSVPSTGAFDGNIEISDATGSVNLYTHSWADFADDPVEGGIYHITAIASKYHSPQLLIRSLDDMEYVGEDDDNDEDPGEPEGDGTFEDPYNVAYAIVNNTGKNLWVEGTIIGVMETTVDPFEPSFEPPFDTPSNIIIADNPDETSLTNALIVQLPPGDIRDALNLHDNEELLGVTAKLLGDLEAYFGQPGMRNTAGYWIDGDGIIPTVGFWDATFSNEDDGIDPFTDHNLLGEQNWKWEHWDGGSAVMSGFTNQDNENENWMISPEIILEDRNGVSLEIREAINFITSYDDLQVLIASDYEEGNDPSESGEWVHFDGFNRPQGDSWNFMDSGHIDISEFDGERIHIAFRYISSDSGAATWQISEVKLYENE